MSNARIVAIGGTSRSVPTLRSLLARRDVDCLYGIFMPGYPAERPHVDALVALAEEHGVPYVVADRVSADVVRRVAELSADAMIGIGVWRSLLSRELLDATRMGFLGVHATPLPRYRGFAGLYWQIINGHDSVTLRAFRLASGVDDGPIVCDDQERPVEAVVDIHNELHLDEILTQYDIKHIELVNQIVHLVATDRVGFLPQDETLATYSCHRGPEDAEIDWHRTTKEVFNFIRAQSRPLYGAFTYFQGRKVTIWRARPRPDFAAYEGRICGKVVQRGGKSTSAIILTRDSALEVIEAAWAPPQDQEASPSEIFSSVRMRCMSAAEACVYLANRMK